MAQVTKHTPKKTKVSLKVSGKRSIAKDQATTEKENFSQIKKSVIFLGGVIVAYLLYILLSGQMSTFLEALNGVDRFWVIAGALCYIAYYFFGVFAYVLAAITEPDYTVGIRDLMSVEAAGIFFNNLTPNGAGAAPAQFIRLLRSGLSAGQAGALQYTRFIIYEASEGIFAAIMLIFRLNWFIETYGDVYLIGMFLFGFKIVEVGFLLLVCLNPRWVISVGNVIVRFAEKRGWLKNPDHWYDLVNSQVMEFSNGFKTAAGKYVEMALTFVVTLLQLGFQYALPWFVLNAFHIPADFLSCLAAGSMLELLTSAVPLPGGTGGAEAGFAFLFKPMFGNVISAGFVVWRMIEYFLPILCAVPMLGLRSRSGLSLNARWERARGRYERKLMARAQGRHVSTPVSGGIKVNLHKSPRLGHTVGSKAMHTSSKTVVSQGASLSTDHSASSNDQRIKEIQERIKAQKSG